MPKRTKRILAWTIAAFVLCGFISNSSAEEITCASMEWDGILNADGTGHYARLLKAVYEPAGVQVKFKVVPWARAVKMAVDAQADAVLAESDFTLTGGLVHPAMPMDIGNVYYLCKKSQPFQDSGSLKGKKIGWIREYNFNKQINLPKGAYTIHEVSNILQGIQMLQAGRLDFFIDYDKGIIAEAKKAAIDISDCRLISGFEEKYFMGFAPNERGRKFAAIFDERMKALYTSQELHIILKSGCEAGAIDKSQSDRLLHFMQIAVEKDA